MEVTIYTLGCKVNQYETQALETELVRRGHVLVPFEGNADAFIINTCSVTAVSDKKSRNVVRRARRRCPNAVVAVCGCYVQTHEDEAKTLGADLITVSSHKIHGPKGAGGLHSSSSSRCSGSSNGTPAEDRKYLSVRRWCSGDCSRAPACGRGPFRCALSFLDGV